MCDVTWNVQEQVDTASFTHTNGSADITVDAGWYLVSHTIRNEQDFALGGTQRRTHVSRLVNGGGFIYPGTFGYGYSRGANDQHTAAGNNFALVEVTANGTVLSVQATEQFSEKQRFGIIQLQITVSVRYAFLHLI